MTRLLLLAFFLASLFSPCFAQTDEDKKKIEQETLIALKKWFDNPSFSNELLDPVVIKQLLDSGRIENGFKEGLWNEYSLDTVMMGQQTEIIVGDKKVPMNFSAILQKERGNYLKGKRDGIWILYKSYDKKPPFNWNRNVVTMYINGLKEGEEIVYHGYGEEYQKPLIVRHWTNGIENGIGKTYYNNYPYNLQNIYNAINGEMWLREAYYPNGQLQIKYNDTIINGEKYQYFREFFETGQQKSTGFYLNGEIQFGTWTSFYVNEKTESVAYYVNGQLNGIYKYFHDNGQIWTERVYKDGKLIEVIANYNKKGKKNNPGTVKDGTGILYIYDPDGNLTKTIDYIDGQEKKGSR